MTNTVDAKPIPEPAVGWQMPCDGGECYDTGHGYKPCERPAEWTVYGRCGCGAFQALLCTPHLRPSRCIVCSKPETTVYRDALR